MAGQYTIQATHKGEADVYWPDLFESTSVSEARIEENGSHVLSPELERSVESEWGTLQHWMAFRMSDHFVGQIYRGELVEIAPEEAISTYLMPEYQAMSGRYQEESKAIEELYVPEIKKKILTYQREALEFEVAANYNQDKINEGDLSPKLAIDALSWRKSAKEKGAIANDLQEDLSNNQTSVLIKNELIHKIEDFTDHIWDNHSLAQVEEIIFASKKRAFEQVINTLKSERALVDNDEKEDGDVIVRGYDRRIELLEAELTALEEAKNPSKAPGGLDELEENMVASSEYEQNPPEVDKRRNFLREMRSRLLGGFGSRAVAVYGASHR